MILENTEINIEAEAGLGCDYAQNVTSIGIGFFGSNYNESRRVVFFRLVQPMSTNYGQDMQVSHLNKISHLKQFYFFVQ
jgi:hypothetical protein